MAHLDALGADAGILELVLLRIRNKAVYIIKNYLTNETVAIVTRKEDAVAMTTGPRRANDPVLIYVKEQAQ
jgi:hypothetical protein